MSDTDKKVDEKKGDDVLKKMLKTPPRQSAGVDLPADVCWLVDDPTFRILGEITENLDGSKAGNLYRNLNDYKKSWLWSQI